MTRAKRGDELADELRPTVAFIRANYWKVSSTKARKEILAVLVMFERYAAANPPPAAGDAIS